ncbi:MAG: ADP-ribosylglycohydrolase family protein [Firmicutes bacterium]|nr:ADP-ribosylglycohydrolase family protein [Bacillota bacterium]
MIGAIAGDVIGSVFEFNNVKSTDFELFSTGSTFTDDTVLTVAVADCILHDKGYAEAFKEYGRRHPDGGYGGRFLRWLHSESSEPYNSYGNGSAMRVSPVGWAYDTLEKVLEEAERSAAVTHNHPEGIKGAQAVAAAIFMAREGSGKKEIREYVEGRFGYNLGQTLDEIRPHYRFDETCQGSVPQAIIAFLESQDFEDAVRKAVSIGGDSDTIACITGGIAQAHYGAVPSFIEEKVRQLLAPDLLEVVEAFEKAYPVK